MDSVLYERSSFTATADVGRTFVVNAPTWQSRIPCSIEISGTVTKVTVEGRVSPRAAWATLKEVTQTTHFEIERFHQMRVSVSGASGATVKVSLQAPLNPAPGILVTNSDELVDAVTYAPAGSEIVIASPLGVVSTYVLENTITPTNGSLTIRAERPANRYLVNGRRGAYKIVPNVHLVGDGENSLLFDLTSKFGVTFLGLGLGNTVYDSDVGQTTGRAISRGSGVVGRDLLLYGHANNALGNIQGEFRFVELYGNAEEQIGGVSGAIKSTQRFVIRNFWIHDNPYHGLWVDCDAPGLVAVDGVITHNDGTGLFYEISRGPGLIQNVFFDWNNISGTAGRGDIIFTSSQDAEIIGCGFGLNSKIQATRIWEDDRFENGIDGCTSGFYIGDVTLKGNQWPSDRNPRMRYNGSSDFTVSADDEYTSPHEGANGIKVVFEDNEYDAVVTE